MPNTIESPSEEALFTHIEMHTDKKIDVAKSKEYALKRIDSTFWVNTYAEDIFQTLKECEMRRRLVLFRSPQSEEHRPSLLRLLRSSVEICRLNRCTLHLAVYFLDRFLDNFTIRLDKLNLTALTCLHIAAQIEDSDPNKPKFTELNQIVGFCYSWEEFRTVERKVLTTFNFELLRPTTATFVEHFARNFLTFDDYNLYKQNYTKQTSTTSNMNNSFQLNFFSYEHMIGYCTNLLFQFADNTLTYHKFVNARPSVLAASCICAVRQQCKIKPFWTPHLTQLTTYNEDLLKPFVEIINTIHQMHLQRQMGLQNANNNDKTNNNDKQTDILNSPAKTQNEYDWSSPDSGVDSLQELQLEQSALEPNVIVLPVAQQPPTTTLSYTKHDIENMPIVLNENLAKDGSVVLHKDHVEYVPQPCDCHDYAMPAKRLKLM